MLIKTSRKSAKFSHALPRKGSSVRLEVPEKGRQQPGAKGESEKKKPTSRGGAGVFTAWGGECPSECTTGTDGKEGE